MKRETYGDKLTRREVDVVRAMIDGNTTNELIADALDIRVGTVRTLLGNVFAKTGARDRTHLVLLALGELEAPANLRCHAWAHDVRSVADRAITGAAYALWAAFDKDGLERLTELLAMRLRSMDRSMITQNERDLHG